MIRTISEFFKTRAAAIMQEENLIEPIDAVDIILEKEEEINDIIKNVRWLLAIDITRQQLIQKLSEYRLDLERVSSISRTKIFRDPMEPKQGGIIDFNDETKCAGAYFNKLRNDGKLGEDDLDRVALECNVIIQQFLPQPAQKCNRLGLVVGQVQSGKTTIFNGIIASAAEMGFNIIIILSGTIEKLRTQTQTRIISDVTEPWSRRENPPFHFFWISTDQQPGLVVAGKANQVLSGIGDDNHRQIAVGVFLKNRKVLLKLRNFLSTLSPLQQSRVRALIIDDEADQATPNGGVNNNRVTAINKAIKNLVIKIPGMQFCPTQGNTSYLGFTATPFANLLNEAGQLTLYPKDFIYFLSSSERYFGPMQLFGNPAETEEEETIIPLNVIRILSDEDISGTVPPTGQNASYNPEMTDGLEKSLIWYILATAARRVSKPDCWSTMLIHTSSRISHHSELAQTVDDFLKDIRLSWRQNLDQWREFWIYETSLVNIDDFNLAFPGYGNPGPSELPGWSAIEELIPSVIDDVKVKIDNSSPGSYERVYYGEDVDKTNKLQIAIGGNTLSRGITLEGLVSSYFARRFTPRSAYDTLLQMGRWFGFRQGYELLSRIWTTSFLRDGFRDLVIMEYNLRLNLQLYLTGVSPATMAPVITRMPAMAITRKTVVGDTEVVEADYSGSAPQTIFFLNDESWLKHNLQTTEKFLNGLANYYVQNNDVKNRRIFEKVPDKKIKQFLIDFNFHQSSNTFNDRHLIKFIENNEEKYAKWTVVVMGGRSDKDFEIQNVPSVKMNTRSRVDTDIDPIINIKSLRSTADLLCDRPELLPDDRREVELWKIRKEKSLNPVLVLFPIDKNSQPLKNKDKTNRVPLNALENLIGVSLIMCPPDPQSGAVGVKVNLGEAYYSEDVEDDDSDNK